MKMFSDCSGPCSICLCGNFCLAGNGDDDFILAPANEILNRLQNNKYSSDRGTMIKTLKNVYNIDYKDEEET